MSENTNDQDQSEAREQLRKQLQEKFGDVDSIGIEPLLDEALENVSGGEYICSLFACSKVKDV